MRRSASWLAAALIVCVFSGYRAQVAKQALRDFGRLPVLHNGRIQPLDTVARNSLLIIRGKQQVRGEGIRMSAAEWLLELTSRSMDADTRKVFRVDNPDILGLIERRSGVERYYSFAEIAPHLKNIETQAMRAQNVEGKLRTRFETAVVNLYSRLRIYHRLKDAIRVEGVASFEGELDAYEKALSLVAKDPSGAMTKLEPFAERYNRLAASAYFRPIPPGPGAPTTAWMNIGEGLLASMHGGAQVSPFIRAYAAMLDAFSKGDGAAFAERAGALAQRFDEQYPENTGRARHEELFNRLQPFVKGMVLYLFSFLAVCFAWLTGKERLKTVAFYLLGAAFLIHSGGLLARMVLQGRPPVTNLYSSAVFVGWGAVMMGIVLERLSRRGFATFVSAIIGFSTLVIAHHLSTSGDTMEMMQAVLDSNFWLATHVITITIGYSAMFLAGMLGHAYIFGMAFNKLNKEGARSLVQMTYGVLCFSLLLTFVGTVLGGIWADQSWGRFWGWDPKENGALLIVLWLAIILHARWGGLIRERGIMVCAVFGNIVTATSWFGVNMLGVGLHSYGFMDKAAFWFIAFSVSQFAVMALAFRGRRRKSLPA